MSIVEAIVLGLVQGLTEFLPISSSGHLILVPWLFGWDEPGLAFDAALHLGTLLAVFFYFWRDLLAMLRAVPTALSRPLRCSEAAPSADGDSPASVVTATHGWHCLLIIGSIPGGIVGLLAQGGSRTSFTTTLSVPLDHRHRGPPDRLWSPPLVGRSRRRPPPPHRRDLTVRDTVVDRRRPGTRAHARCLSLRVNADRRTLLGLRRADAARFSFLLGTPLVILAGLNGLKDILDANPSGSEVTTMLVGILVSAASGFAAISILLRYLQRSSAAVFVIYRLVAGLLILGLVAAGVGSRERGRTVHRVPDLKSGPLRLKRKRKLAASPWLLLDHRRCYRRLRVNVAELIEHVMGARHHRFAKYMAGLRIDPPGVVGRRQTLSPRDDERHDLCGLPSTSSVRPRWNPVAPS